MKIKFTYRFYTNLIAGCQNFFTTELHASLLHTVLLPTRIPNKDGTLRK